MPANRSRTLIRVDVWGVAFSTELGSLQSTFSAGTLSVVGDALVQPTGVSATTALGTAAGEPEHRVFPTGLEFQTQLSGALAIEEGAGVVLGSLPMTFATGDETGSGTVDIGWGRNTWGSFTWNENIEFITNVSSVSMSTAFNENYFSGDIWNVMVQRTVVTSSNSYADMNFTQSYNMFVARKDDDKIQDVQFISMSSHDVLSISASNINIDSSGKLGIGTTSPSTKLHVVGDALIDGYVHADKDGSPGLLVGEGGDADIYYDGTDMYINPQRVGSGDLIVNNGNCGN